MSIFLVSKDDGLVLFSNISHIPIHPFTLRKAKIPKRALAFLDVIGVNKLLSLTKTLSSNGDSEKPVASSAMSIRRISF